MKSLISTYDYRVRKNRQAGTVKVQLYIILDERHGAQLGADDHLQRFFFGLLFLHMASYG